MSAKKGNIRIKQIKSGIGYSKKQRAVLKSLRLGKMNKIVEMPNNDAIRGMIRKIPHLVKIVEEKK